MLAGQPKQPISVALDVVTVKESSSALGHDRAQSALAFDERQRSRIMPGRVVAMAVPAIVPESRANRKEPNYVLVCRPLGQNRSPGATVACSPPLFVFIKPVALLFPLRFVLAIGNREVSSCEQISHWSAM
jgi:hypothetical protein